MAIARPKEGPRAPLFYGALIAAFAAFANAQTIERSELERCAVLETEAAKLACFEAIVSGPAVIAEAAEEAAPESPPPPVPATVDLPDDEFGREHLDRDRAEDANVLHATVTEVEKDRFGALIFHLDNGQVWKQMEPRYYPYPRNEAFDVVISRGVMGEYRLQVNSAGRTVTIRRTK